MFSGSYLKDDVEFLLKVIDIEPVETSKKEELIQSKKRHYSEMISPEYQPSKEYLDIFYRAFELNSKEFARDILSLAKYLSQKDSIVLVSLVRAGTPIGVLLKRILREIFAKEVNHYSISIVRDREIDTQALKYIYSKNRDCEFIFVDGWTGKGVINRELKKFISKFNSENSLNISDRLYVISDIAGVADFSVNSRDYLIPSSILNSTISGLVSRSILNRDYIKEGDFHGCKFYSEFRESDLTLWFVDSIMDIVRDLNLEPKELKFKDEALNQEITTYLQNLKQRFNIEDINYIKPGIAESTRVLLRRVPDLLIVKDLNSKDIEHLLLLSKEREVRVVKESDLPYSALAIIKDLKK